MPNYVAINMNVACKDAEQLNAFLEAIRQDPAPEDREPAVICFNRIIPMPESLRGTVEGTYSTMGYDAWHGDPSSILSYPWVKEAGVTTREELQAFLDQQSPEYRVQGDRAKAAEEATGSRSWYHWCLEHWGTKWNACHTSLQTTQEASVQLQFETAWSVPEPVLAALAERFPDVEFSGDFLDEGWCFQGTFTKTPDGVVFHYEDCDGEEEE
mgnify:CR=1 FL=1